jgi:hypothetical protein
MIRGLFIGTRFAVNVAGCATGFQGIGQQRVVNA